MDDEFELGWAIGFFEGEGTIGVYGKTNHVTVSVSNTNLAMLRKFQRIMGCGRICIARSAGPRNAKLYKWHVSSIGQAHAVLDVFYPHLSARRRRQARKVYAVQYKRQS